MPFLESSIAHSGRFTDIRLLGHGASGQVYYALDTRLNVPVAIKEVLPADRDFQMTLDKFKRESQIQARLRHTNIISVYDLKEDSRTGEYYLVCEYANAGTLAEYLQRHGPLAEPVAIGIAIDICNALEKLRGEGVVHCDIKPANILLSRDGHGALTAKLADFGIAKGQLWRETTMLPGSHHPGTPLYMAPEQWSVANILDVRTDIYALGATLFEILTLKVYKQVADTGPLDLHAYASSSSQGIAEVIQKATDDDRQQRYQNPRDMLDDLQAVLRGDPLITRRVPPRPGWPGAESWRARRLLFPSLGLLGGVMIALLLAIQRGPGSPGNSPIQASASVPIAQTTGGPGAQESPTQAQVASPSGQAKGIATSQASSPTPPEAHSTKTYRVLVDTRHDNGTIERRFISMQLEHFEFVASSSHELSADLLGEYDALVIYYSPLKPDMPEFTTQEIEAIKAYLRHGGSLFLGGLGWTWPQYMHKDIEEYPLNQIANDFGIFFTSDPIADKDDGSVVHGRTMMNTEHAITKGVTWIGTGKGANPGAFRIAAPALPIVWGDEQAQKTGGLQRPPVVVAAEVDGGGRLVGVHHPDYLLDRLDNNVLVENCLRWLVHLA
jgi:serine/threonine protein kinase